MFICNPSPILCLISGAIITTFLISILSLKSKILPQTYMHLFFKDLS